MKRVFSVGLMAGLMALGIQSKAEAVVSLDVRICQGTICQDFAAQNGPGPINNGGVVVGDFLISGSVASLENAALSNAQTSTISVYRTSLVNDAEGDSVSIWLNASGYGLPDITSGYVFQTVLSATSSAAPAANVSYQGWLSTTNYIGFDPLLAGVSPGSNGCLAPAGTGSCAAATGVLGGIVGATPFSMTTRTTFTIASASETASYGSTAQANITAVPEPGSMMLLGTGLLGLARVARRRFAKPAR